MSPMLRLLKEAFAITREEDPNESRASAFDQHFNVDIDPAVSVDDIVAKVEQAYQAAGFEVERTERHDDMTGYARRKLAIANGRGAFQARVVMLREGPFFSFVAMPQ